LSKRYVQISSIFKGLTVLFSRNARIQNNCRSARKRFLGRVGLQRNDRVKERLRFGYVTSKYSRTFNESIFVKNQAESNQRTIIPLLF